MFCRCACAVKFSSTANSAVFSVVFVFNGVLDSHEHEDDAPDHSPPRVYELERLQRLDTASKVGRTAQTFHIIRRRPEVVSTLLAVELESGRAVN